MIEYEYTRVVMHTRPAGYIEQHTQGDRYLKMMQGMGVEGWQLSAVRKVLRYRLGDLWCPVTMFYFMRQAKGTPKGKAAPKRRAKAAPSRKRT